MIRILIILLFWSVCMGLGLFMGYSYHSENLKDKETIRVNTFLKEVRSVFKLQILEVSGFAKMEHSEKTNNAMSFLTNPLFAKEYYIQIPYRAKYGFDIEDPRFELYYTSDTVFSKIPPCKLLSFELLYSQKEVFVKEGWLISADDKKLEPFEKRLYETEKKTLEEDKNLMDRAQKQSIQALKTLLSPIGKPIEIH